jgi:hypothetical protein
MDMVAVEGEGAATTAIGDFGREGNWIWEGGGSSAKGERPVDYCALTPDTPGFF